MTELDDRLREHFGDVALSPDALVRLHDDVERRLRENAVQHRRRATDARGRRPRRPWLESLLGPRASGREGAVRSVPLRLAFASLLIAALAVGMHLNGSFDERSERTLSEVAMNHATRLEVEFEEPTVAGLGRRMRLLPFEMSAPRRLGEEVDVLGSRYCTLAGRLAAHIKVRDRKTGAPVSLFVTSAAPELERLDGDIGRIDGVEVELFREGGLFYALARPAV